MNLDDIKKPVGDLVSKIWLPALMGAAGTGTVAGYMSGRDRRSNEAPAERRKRILRAALIGAALGGTAGAAIPAGISMSAGRATGKPGMIESALDKGITTGTNYALPGAVAAGGGLAISKHMGSRQTAMQQQILNAFGRGGKASFSGGRTATSPAQLKAMLKLDPNLVGELERALTGAAPLPKGGPPRAAGSLYQVYDMINEAGFKDSEQLASKGRAGNLWGMINDHKVTGGAGPVPAHNKALASWLKEQGPVSKLVSKIMSADGGETLRAPIQVAGKSIDRGTIGQIYRRIARPSLGRVPLPVQLGLLGAGVLGANHIQRRVQGD